MEQLFRLLSWVLPHSLHPQSTPDSQMNVCADSQGESIPTMPTGSQVHGQGAIEDAPMPPRVARAKHLPVARVPRPRNASRSTSPRATLSLSRGKRKFSRQSVSERSLAQKAAPAQDPQAEPKPKPKAKASLAIGDCVSAEDSDGDFATCRIC